MQCQECLISNWKIETQQTNPDRLRTDIQVLCFSFAPEHTKTFLHLITIQSIPLSIYSPIYPHDLCWGGPWIESCICNSLLVPTEICKRDFGYISIIKVNQFLQDAFWTAWLWRLRFCVLLKCQNYLPNNTASHSIWLESSEYFFTPNLNFSPCYMNAVALFPNFKPTEVGNKGEFSTWIKHSEAIQAEWKFKMFYFLIFCKSVAMICSILEYCV